MKFDNIAFSLADAWSSPFVRWQGSLADLSSLDLAVTVTRDAMAAREVDASRIGSLVIGATIPQMSSFYAAPWVAAQLGLPEVSGPMVSQACATSVACLASAAFAHAPGSGRTTLVLTTDRTSNGPLLVYPRTQSMGGSPLSEHWVLDSFAADPATGQSMVVTADNVAREGRMTREGLDALTLLRWSQYQSSLAQDRAFQRQYMQPVRIAKGRSTATVDADEGVHAYSQEGLAALKPALLGSVVTHGGQTHPADGCAGVVLGDVSCVRERSGGDPVVSLVSVGFARAGKAQMPKAATLAARQALADAGLQVSQIALIGSHNPFAVNDVWLSQQMDFPLERMNVKGCSLIYGHPQGPTGMRGIIELAWSLKEAGGGLGLFTGCAAGDTGAAIVIRVD
ncbi:thiolase family protein [Variovorax sp. J22R24]|uniref:thiolase family protein n=1 Tax=Variovorax gracilis TaxID=3053502 RepID=UPI0025769AA2|nr:thiolase family protein [Variovorax sp. J22R24]MDM0109251.1 thiolase family protein [Variovorax sp. J22R24]